MSRKPKIPKRTKSVKIIYVRWFDANFVDEQYEETELPDHDCVMSSCGILVSQNEHYLRLAIDYNETAKAFRTITTIPKVNVIEKKIITI